ncbi:MAG TPA: MFS transporter [Caulobacterales bacterium]|nr:MFS transporter [Caulobacterales bacterium]
MAAPILTRAQTLAFALPGGPLGAIALPPLVFLPNYFNATLGAPLAAVSAIFLLSRVSDIIIDPLLGGAQDRTRAAMGPRKAWMLFGLIPLCALLWLVFIGWAPGASPALIGASVLAMYAAYSAVLIAHLGWAGELAPDYHGRTRMLGFVQAASAAGTIIVLILPAIAGLAGLGEPAMRVHLMGWVLIAALPLTILLAVKFVPEPRTARGEPIKLRAAFAAIAENRALRFLLGADFAVGVSQGVAGTLFVFFFQYKLGFTREAELLVLIYFLAALIGIPLWMRVARGGAKHRTMALACLFAAIIAATLPILPPNLFWLAAIGIFLAGLPNGAHILLLRAMMVDVVDEDEVKTGARHAGLFFGLLLTTSKAGAALGPLTLAVLAFYGFDGKLGAGNAPAAMTALTFLFIAPQVLLYLFAAWIMRAYPLDEARQRALRAQLDLRAAP